jgi:hypothetical protein
MYIFNNEATGQMPMASFLRTGPFFSGSLQYQVCGTATIQSLLARKTLK